MKKGMKAKHCIEILRFKAGLNMKDIANSLGVDTKTAYSWFNCVEPRKKELYKKLEKLIAESGFDFEKSIEEVIEIDKIIENISKDEWKDFILGMQEKLNLEQFELLDKAKLKMDFHVSEWISGKRIPHQLQRFRFAELCVKNSFEPKEVIMFGKNARKSVKVGDEWIPVGNIMNRREFGCKLIYKRGDSAFINTGLLFPDFINENQIKFAENNGNLIVFYPEKRSTRPEPLILQKELELNQDFLVGLGIYLGEGSRNRKPKVTNSEPIIIEKAIEFFEILGVKKSKLKGWIQIHERSDKSFEEARNYWLKNTSLENRNITSTRIRKSTGSAHVKNYGTLHVESPFILSQLLVQKLLGIVPDILNASTKKGRICFLQGLFAGEGSVFLSKRKSVASVDYTSKKPEERYIVQDLLKEIGISSVNDDKYYRIRMYGYNNFRKLVDIDIFKYHPDRKNKLITGFERLKFNLTKVG